MVSLLSNGYTKSVEASVFNHSPSFSSSSVLIWAFVLLSADNGIGMPEDVRARIFDYLFTTKSIGKGTGLGLAIARQIIVEKHDGAIAMVQELQKLTKNDYLISSLRRSQWEKEQAGDWRSPTKL